MARLSPRAAPRHLVSTRRAPPSSPPRLVRVRNPQRRASPAFRRRPVRARRRPARLRGEASVGGVRGFHPRVSTGSGC
jgi:hypothetical protein